MQGTTQCLVAGLQKEDAKLTSAVTKTPKKRGKELKIGWVAITEATLVERDKDVAMGGASVLTSTRRRRLWVTGQRRRRQEVEKMRCESTVAGVEHAADSRSNAKQCLQ
jgi:hypothetical protein